MTIPAILPSTMLAIQAAGPGGPDVLRPVPLPVPAPGPGEILIRVAAVAVNFSDVMRRRGQAYPFPTSFPYTPGSEVAGTVAALGSGVAGPAVGTPVSAVCGVGLRMGTSGYAQFALAAAPAVSPLPPGLDPAVACGLVVNGATAVLALEACARVSPGETVLVQGATGGVGSYAVQLARRLGAGRVIAGIGDRAKAGAARALGADAVVVYSEPGWTTEVLALTGERGADVVLEMAGGPVFTASLGLLAPFGRMVVYGDASGQGHAIDHAAARRLFAEPMAGASIVVCNLGMFFAHRPAVAGAAIGTVVQALMAGSITAPPLATLPLTEAAQAHRRLESRAVVGKLVLDPWA
jgi:NADPH2:quinone reductase